MRQAFLYCICNKRLKKLYMPKPFAIVPGSIGHRLVMALAYKAKPQMWLAAEAGCSAQAISQVINGKLKDARGNGILTEIAAALGVETLWLAQGLGDPPWATTTPIINQGYYPLVRQIRLEYKFKNSVGVHVDLPEGVTSADVLSLSWKPEVEVLFAVANKVGVEVDGDAVRRDYQRIMTVEVREAIEQALQMAIGSQEEHNGERYRSALQWAKAMSE